MRRRCGCLRNYGECKVCCAIIDQGGEGEKGSNLYPLKRTHTITHLHHPSPSHTSTTSTLHRLPLSSPLAPQSPSPPLGSAPTG